MPSMRRVLLASSAAVCVTGSRIVALRGNAAAEQLEEGQSLSSMQPEVVASMLAGMEESWVQRRAASLAGTDDEAKSHDVMRRTCNKVASAVVQASSGDWNKVAAYMEDVCAADKIDDSEKVDEEKRDLSLCQQFGSAIVSSMKGDPNFNRNELSMTKVCSTLYDGPVAEAAHALFELQKASQEKTETENLDRAKAVAEAEEKEKKIEEEQAAKRTTEEAEAEKEAEAQADKEAKAEADAKAVDDAKAKTEQEATEKADAERKAKDEEEAAAMAKLVAKAEEEKAKAQAEADKATALVNTTHTDIASTVATQNTTISSARSSGEFADTDASSQVPEAEAEDAKVDTVNVQESDDVITASADEKADWEEADTLDLAAITAEAKAPAPKANMSLPVEKVTDAPNATNATVVNANVSANQNVSK